MDGMQVCMPPHHKGRPSGADGRDATADVAATAASLTTRRRRRRAGGAASTRASAPGRAASATAVRRQPGHHRDAERLDRPFSLDEMTEIAHLSPFHFNRVFRQLTGGAPAPLPHRAAHRGREAATPDVPPLRQGGLGRVGYRSLGWVTAHQRGRREARCRGAGSARRTLKRGTPPRNAATLRRLRAPERARPRFLCERAFPAAAYGGVPARAGGRAH